MSAPLVELQTTGSEALQVAFIARRFGARFGGAEAYAEHLLAQLMAHYPIHVFCQEWDSQLPLPHTVLPRPRGLPRWVNLWRFSQQCARLTRHFDIVHSHENAPTGHVHGVHVMPVRYARRQRDRTVGRRLATFLSLRWQAYLHLEAARYRAAPDKVLVAASTLIDTQIAAVYPATARRVVIVPGVALPVALPVRAEARHRLGIPEDLPVGILIANDPWRKGYAALLAALAAPAGGPWRLLVVGGEGDTAIRVREAAAAAGVGEQVLAWPGQHDVWPFYAAADFCVFPTLGDAFGMVPLEAMALGLPVILSSARHCGFAAHVRDGEHALILNDPHDASSLATTVARLLNEPDLAGRLAQAGRALATDFSWTAIATAYRQEYERIGLARQGLARSDHTR